MKIGQQLALKFTIVSALLTAAILIMVYSITRRYVHEDFIERLFRQSSLEVLHYATPHVKDVIPAGSFLLINPLTSIFDKDGNLLHQNGRYPRHSKWITSLNDEEAFRVDESGYTTIGKRYTINGRVYLVFVSDKDLPGQHELDIFFKAIVVGWLSSIVLAYLAGMYFSSNALKPVKRVVNEVNQITKDNLGYRLTSDKALVTPDELEELIRTFNALLDRIESAFTAQKRFVQHASHEIKTPLTAIMGEAELALTKERSAAEYKRTLSVVVSETERLVNITQGLLTLARFEEGYYSTELTRINLSDILAQEVANFSFIYPERQPLKVIGDSNVVLLGSAELLQIAIHNLVDNAYKYSNEEVQFVITKFDSYVQLEVRDKGIGIPAADLHKVRSPMFRASNVKGISGAGLGIPLVNRIVEFHKGTLSIESKENVGTIVKLTVPIIT